MFLILVEFMTHVKLKKEKKEKERASLVLNKFHLLKGEESRVWGK